MAKNEIRKKVGGKFFAEIIEIIEIAKEPSQAKPLIICYIQNHNKSPTKTRRHNDHSTASRFRYIPHKKPKKTQTKKKRRTVQKSHTNGLEMLNIYHIFTKTVIRLSPHLHKTKEQEKSKPYRTIKKNGKPQKSIKRFQ